MRVISDAAIAFVSTQKGVEPLNFIKVEWTPGAFYYYADRTIHEYNIVGGILELANLDNVVNVSGSNASQSVSIVLNDTDGIIKNIYDYNDIHKRPVTIYQWFEGLSLSDAFIIFQGYINSPIIWKEGDRTMSFDVVSKLEDIEVGFSPEEGQFGTIPTDMIGKAWPLPFGTTLKVPAILVDPINTLTSLDSNGIPDPSLPKEIFALGKKIIELGQFADAMFKIANYMYLQASPSHDPTVVEDQHFEDLGDQYMAAGNKALVEKSKAEHDMANLSQLYIVQKTFAKKGIRVSGAECLKPGEQLNVDIGGAKHLVTVDGNVFVVNQAEHPSENGTTRSTQVQTIPTQSTVSTGAQDVIQQNGFFWVQAGSTIHILSDMPIRYIIAMIPVNVANVWASRNFNDAKVLMQVPTEYYTVSLQSFGSIVATILTLSRPLSQRNEGWDDDISIDMISPIGPNTVDIIVYLITNYTNIGIDSTSFNQVKNRIVPFPSDFCLFNKTNIIQLLSDICFQARLAIWINNGVFFLRYLPDEPPAVDSISSADIISNTLEIHHTDTESVVTKLTATYKTDYAQKNDNKIILRNNVVKYGTHEETDNWFIYLNQYMVDLAATFWLIRKSNVWKLAVFKTPLHKLRLETFDAVTLNLPSVAITPVTGIINSIHLDTQNLQIEFEVWVPVRLGEMTKFDFAWPVDSEVNIYPQDIELAGSGGPGANANGDLVLFQGACYDPVPFTIKKPKRKSANHGSYNPGGQPAGAVVLNTQIAGLDNTARPRFDYNYNQYRVQEPAVDQAKPVSVPGQIISGEGPEYKAKLYMRGMSGKTTEANVKCVDVKAEKLEADAWITVLVLVWVEKVDNKDVVKVEKVFLPSGASSPGTFPGQVQSGTAFIYQVRVYKEGLAGPTVLETVKQLDIDPAETIPVNTWVMVVQGKNTTTGETEYTMQVPIFLE